MRKKNSKKWTLVLILLLVVSIGYAALASNLKINGTTGVKSATWDVYWNNVQVTQGSVEATEGNQARITDQAKTQVEYSVTLNEPGDFYEFTVDAVNNGTIDAMIASNGIVDGVYTDAEYQHAATLPDAIKYSVTYADGTEIAPKHLLAKKNGNTPTTETYKVRIEYRNDNDVDPEDLEEVTNQTYYFKFSVNYVQADKTATPSHVSAIHYVRRQNEGQITPGDVIGIGETEDFYVISSTSEKTVLLAKYNLLVGVDGDENFISLDTQGYGLQNEYAVGYDAGFYYAMADFSSADYWMNNDTLLSPYNENDTIYYDSHDYKLKYRSNDTEAYPYVYDSTYNTAPDIVDCNSQEDSYECEEIHNYKTPGYSIAYYVEQYKAKLVEMGAPSTITGRLLSYEEADSAKEIEDGSEYGNSIILGTGQSYLLGSLANPDAVWCVYYGDFNYDGFHYGVRPVIEIPTSEIN